MNATHNSALGAHGSTLFFDAECGLCSSEAERWRGVLEKRGVAVLPLQSLEARRALHLEEGVTPDEIKLVAGGCVFGGADALIEIARRISWARPLAFFAAFPGVRPVLCRAYQTVAARRNCSSGACGIGRGKSPRAFTYGLLIVLPMAALLTRNVLPDWAFMWLLAGAMFVGCKWLVLSRARNRSSAGLIRLWAFFIGWIGMDAERFVGNRQVAAPARSEWLAALSKTLLGFCLIWAVARLVPAHAPIIRGWCGLLGIVFLLHFGTFHLLALCWRRVGIDARPIMRAPLLALSPSDFWSRRWNLAFHDLAESEVFKPLLRRTNAAFALFVTFLASGLVHDLVISLPARGGYGLPTVYFLLQGLGIILERSAFGKRLGLNDGWLGRLFAWVITLGPVTLLFHEPFITRIILPFLEAIGAL